MSNAIVWLDGKTAKIFEFAGESVTHRVYHRHDAEHVPEHTAKAGKALDRFFHGVAEHLRATQAFIIVGPGVAKQQFVHHLQRHHHDELAKHLRSVESTDHPTDEQLIAQGREFFAHYQRTGLVHPV